MVTKTKAQIHMDETIIEDEVLEKMLEDRQELKQSVSDYRALEKKVKEKILTIETPTPFRLGRFVISRQDVGARSVAFDTGPGSRLTIKLAGEE